MRAISRVVVPAVTEQDWAEDMLAVAPAYARQSPQQIPSARVFCPDGSVREVPLDFADRAICPMRVGSNDQGRLTRPDSAFDNGRRVDARAPRGPVRVGDPNDPHYGARNDVPRGRPTTKPSTPATPVTPAPARPPRRDNPAARPTPTPDDKHEAKREAQEQKREARDDRKDAKSAEQEARKADREERQEAKKEEQAERKDERAEARDARTEAKADAKEERQDAKEERKDAKEARKDAKPEPKDEAREEQKDSARDDKGEATEEQKADKQPESERRGQGRPSQAGKPNKKS